MKLAAARIFVDNLEQARVFYEGTLGLTVAAVGPQASFVVYDVQSCNLIVEQVASTGPCRPVYRALVQGCRHRATLP
ncbi:MAG: hypothetical protein LW854_22150 [Rubrivivax sp.]|nr:hypothetical protein [Rubrivivax sp.]